MLYPAELRGRPFGLAVAAAYGKCGPPMPWDQINLSRKINTLDRFYEIILNC
jgi:hypothetical protein